VLPRSRRVANTWENLVACCFGCNNRKGGRTPQEAGMVLARQPRPIGLHARETAGRAIWSKYLFE
jgi:5-methylcytosine-specific restriction endonuclease McrA